MTEIRRIRHAAAVHAAAALFDNVPREDATERFLREPGHHIFLAYDGRPPVGMVTGVETTHPDKGTEMFLCELLRHVGADRRLEPGGHQGLYRRRGDTAREHADARLDFTEHG